MTLGEKIRFLRTKESITQEELAEKLNVSRSAIAKWETDNGTPDIANLKMISQIFKISIDELLKDELGLSDSIIDEEKKDTGCEVYEGYYWKEGKRPYQKALLPVASAVLVMIIAFMMFMIMK